MRVDGTPYYAGKGYGTRAFSHKHSFHPPKNPSRVLVFPQECEADAFESEKAMIALFGRKDIGTGCLRNLTDGGEGSTGYRHTEAAKQKDRESHLGRQPGLGILHTDESKLKISQNRKGKNLGNCNAAGRVCSAEHKRAISQKLTGKKFSVEHNEKIRQARIGVPRPDVTAANRRRWSDPASRLKQSEKQKSLGSHLLVRDAHGRIMGRKGHRHGTSVAE